MVTIIMQALTFVTVAFQAEERIFAIHIKNETHETQRNNPNECDPNTVCAANAWLT